MAKGEDEIADATAIDLMTNDVEASTRLEKGVENMDSLTRRGGDDFGMEWSISAGDRRVKQRKLVEINTPKLEKRDILTEAKVKVEAAIAEFYDQDIAKSFMDAHGNALLAEDGFQVREGFNVLVMVEAAEKLPSN